MKRVLLVAATTGYQVREFAEAARSLNVDLVLATDRCHILSDPWGDNAAPVRFEDPEPGIDALAARGPFDGILAVGDRPAYVAAQAAERFGLRFHSPHAAKAAGNKLLTRECFRAAGMLVPAFQLGEPLDYPCVVKPLNGSASRGVIRTNDEREFRDAAERVRRMGFDELLVEDYIPGRELALEGVVTGGKLTTLALFDKPDPLEGPFFEESIYVTPSREPNPAAIHEAAQAAVTALGLTDGPVHAEMRLNDRGVWMLEVAARPIGGLCARVLRFGAQAEGLCHAKLEDLCRGVQVEGSCQGARLEDLCQEAGIRDLCPGAESESPRGTGLPAVQSSEMGLEELLLRHALGEDVSGARLLPGEHGVMMIPIPRAGAYHGVDGLEQAREVPGIADIVITAKAGQALLPLPEGSSYLGFIFARGANVEKALRRAHLCLQFHLSAPIPVVK